MAKIIKYKILAYEVNHGTEDEPQYEPILFDKELICDIEANFEGGLLIAQEEAYNGEYTVEGEFDEETTSPEERIAELEEALNMLLNGVTE